MRVCYNVDTVRVGALSIPVYTSADCVGVFIHGINQRACVQEYSRTTSKVYYIYDNDTITKYVFKVRNFMKIISHCQEITR